MKNTLITLALGLSFFVSLGALTSARGDSESTGTDCDWIDGNPNPPVLIPMETCDYSTDHTTATDDGAECVCSDEGGCSWILTDVHARAQ